MTPQQIVDACQPHPMHDLTWQEPYVDADFAPHLGYCEPFCVYGQPAVTRDELDNLAGQTVDIDYQLHNGRIKGRAYITRVAQAIDIELTLAPTGPFITTSM